MSNTGRADRRSRGALATAIALSVGCAQIAYVTAQNTPEASNMAQKKVSSEALSQKQQSIPLIAAAMATSDMPKLSTALNRGLDAGLTISEAKEILVQLYAYAGFP